MAPLTEFSYEMYANDEPESYKTYMPVVMTPKLMKQGYFDKFKFNSTTFEGASYQLSRDTVQIEDSKFNLPGF